MYVICFLILVRTLLNFKTKEVDMGRNPIVNFSHVHKADRFHQCQHPEFQTKAVQFSPSHKRKINSPNNLIHNIMNS